MKKNLFHTAFIIMFLSAVFISCGEEIQVESITLNKSSALVHLDSVLDLSATIRPFTATNKVVIWTSSNNRVATVTESTISPLRGVVTARDLGETTITVTARDGNHSATASIAVTMPPVGYGCNGNLPGWGLSLGTVSFTTSQEWTVGNQIWSDAVTATACNKTSFNGGSANNSNADCRSNPGFSGDLFSWCAVMRFATILCPYPWRVPTQQDFIDMDIALNGDGRSIQRMDTASVSRFINNWGGFFTGMCIEDGEIRYSASGFYWSQTESGRSFVAGLGTIRWAMFFNFNTSGWVSLEMNISTAEDFKQRGKTLRCVRDNN